MLGRVRFQDRRDAGRQLADRLAAFRDENTVIVGLPRGGVEIAFEVARALDVPLDVIVSRKIGAPSQPELGIGAVAPGNIQIVDDQIVREIGLSEAEIEKAAAKSRAEMYRLIREYRGGEELPPLKGKTVIIVDDGLATGVTARASILAARKAGGSRIILAVPVCAVPTAASLQDVVDELICIELPESFIAVGAWYRDFHQTSDAKVIELLEEARGEVSPEDFSEL